ncbi:hypothetical protein A3C60_01655 [Candidatus Nomurabacteria bacterium RIFCSPHIGHO2_02_FULL_37_45]|uniref:Peptidoglycan binding-like domain-containing protein n=1 Tax=Candidatus Nomurabacteria bacterium RIFCSPHIGHO2_12_FULL_37_29 TaxID=1801759 RepID=A0A1F6WBR4_9BACT|nr:MAG: hypothetical protein A3C60_01655 [Candidatus Nomurabacteria bacterium RIFCSPHIGHO2_02_FULL_37_45]OGI79350.1 MAG: hypothetical protein A3F19_00775 [Candidatus Nomurabacteria bacterium RIFCSPHIGHO2_12_FULL_37_29]OGI84403.1 MAG: hypothetical protein A3A92_02280 [Candidatus Nomurabacteria bacterium RIFCSPLOWO2_01_FULL_37_49]
MIKKLKVGLLIAVLSLAVGVGSAFAADLTFNTNTTLTVNGNDYFIGTGSTATSVVVDGTTATFVVPASSTLTLISTGRHTLSNDGGLTAVCTNTESTLTITGAATVIVTPSTTACGAISGGGGGGGGGGGSIPPVTPPVTPPVVSPGCSGGNVYNTSTGALCMSSVAQAAIAGCDNRTSGFSITTGGSCVGNIVSAAATSYNFGTKTLKNGSRGDAVMELQRFLNQVLNLGLVVDGKLGPKTIAVIKKWQKDNGLVVDGLIGPKTKAKMNASVQ